MSEIDPNLSRLYREASSAGPPPAVDAAILDAARKQLAHSRRPARSSWVRWMAPASALATLVVAVSIAFLVEREQPETNAGSIIKPSAPRPQSPAPASATESTKAKAADSAAPAAAAKKAAPATAASSTAPVPAVPAQAPVSAVPAPSAAEAFPADSRAKAIAPGTAAPKATAEPNIARDPASGGVAAGAPAAPAAAGRIAPLRQQAISRSPEAWLEEISRLKREGRDREVAEQLAEFRRVYPAYAVPQTLTK